MIFVTVGTHEQGFDRLIKHLDYLVECGKISDDIIIQTGFTTFKPKYCQYSKFIDAPDMATYMKSADLVISHGGPATYMTAISHNIPTIVVPRLSKFNEHVNDHQLDFANKVNRHSQYNLTVVTDIEDLHTQIINKLGSTQEKIGKSNTSNFINKFTNLLESMI